MIAAAHRSAMSALADRYFAEQCERLGPVGQQQAAKRHANSAARDERNRRGGVGPHPRIAERAVGLDRFRL